MSETFDDIDVRLTIEGYRSHRRDTDEMVAQAHSCAECGEPRQYLGYRKGTSYRAFAWCAKCDRMEEF
jgi:hypothetical protein